MVFADHFLQTLQSFLRKDQHH
uniref:Uncharacterized protein n=1 Tax=Anguilla anguilla TaxID=7936 RepID=A0A0E9Y1T8_ANGAN